MTSARHRSVGQDMYMSTALDHCFCFPRDFIVAMWATSFLTAGSAGNGGEGQETDNKDDDEYGDDYLREENPYFLEKSLPSTKSSKSGYSTSNIT
eukprot:CAMPEP_0172519354 /NCGR_PEP_ID=MMETSP1066-20121228/291363_1 /TAXON_ID=671091 /ORGANISM="Coscinodiscus wailesii, Strain CCMP2513" /LENGTH=94 /DNA_ID=CAMNT_0013301923 /DNA_START=1136 /DNA_END=1421 /DNA_ORIENTATION=+